MAWSEQDMQRALHESLQTAPLRGTPLTAQVMREMQIFWESQAPGSDTCGMNALNNLCQRHIFSVEELQQGEAQHAQSTQGGNFAQKPQLAEMPSGFFDVEALKIAAAAKDLEIVEVEPVSDYRRSRCFQFAEVADTWLLGFLVYDRQPGQMHYYALRRHSANLWIKLDSQGETRNCLLRDAELWEVYASSQMLFQSWLLRWYPVVHRGQAVRHLRRSVELRGRKLSDGRCERILKESGWLVSAAIQHLLEKLPVLTLRQLLVKFARPSELEMQELLEAAGWDLSRAQPAIDSVLKHRIALAKQVDCGETTLEALSLCDWDPEGAAALLSLRLHLGSGRLAELQQALALAGDADRAEQVVQLKAELGSMERAAKLLEQTQSLAAARKVLELRKRFPFVAVGVAMEVLRRNDEDPHASGEMLEEFRQRVRRLVAEECDEFLVPGEDATVAENALDRCGWDPAKAFLAARNLAVAVKKTRQLAASAVQHPSFSGRFSADATCAALVATELRPKAALAVLLGEPWQRQEAEVEDQGCCVT